MPRQGQGHIAHNAIDPTVPQILHGFGPEWPEKVARAEKTATPPVPEKGAGLEGLPAAGGLCQGLPKKGPSAYFGTKYPGSQGS